MKINPEIGKHSSISCHILNKTKLLDNQNIRYNGNTKNLLTRCYQLSYSIHRTFALIHQLLQKIFLLILKKTNKINILLNQNPQIVFLNLTMHQLFEK